MGMHRISTRRARLALCAATVGLAVAGGLAAPAGAGKGGEPAEPAEQSCGIGREEAAFLREFDERPGAGEAALLDPNDPKYACTGKG